MAKRRKTSFRIVLFALLLTLLGTFYCDFSWLLESFQLCHKEDSPALRALHDSLFMNEKQCRVAFPELANEIDQAVARGPFKLKKKSKFTSGLIQARIKGGKLYIISADPQPNRDKLAERTAILSQLHRAIITSPTPLPDTIITVSLIDEPRQNAWSFSRPSDLKTQENYWLMPHFSFWSWPKPFIGTMDTALSAIAKLEASTTWEQKVDKIVWRGTVWFNPVANLDLRKQLLEVTKGKAWADVEELVWGNGGEEAENALRIEEFCGYKYIVYTEGITYSGRLPFHQACSSIILTPPLNYLMHTTHLMRPLFSSSLPFSPCFSSQHHPLPKSDPRWPTPYTPSEANIIFVSPDWSDLEQTVLWLQSNPEIAEGIAKRQRDMIARAGYLSEAAEMCYWRSLIRSWSEVAKPDLDTWGISEGDGFENEPGVRWETFLLTGKTK